MELERGQYVKGWFGTALITDIAYGFVTDAATDEQIGPAENLIRIKQGRGENATYTFIYPEDVKEIL